MGVNVIEGGGGTPKNASGVTLFFHRTIDGNFTTLQIIANFSDAQESTLTTTSSKTPTDETRRSKGIPRVGALQSPGGVWEPIVHDD